MTVAECKPIIEEMEYDRLVNSDSIQKEAGTLTPAPA